MQPITVQLPAEHTDAIVFGSFNQYAKITDDCLRLWASVLKRVRDSRKDSPLAHCFPVSVPFHDFFNLMHIVQTPAHMVLLYESPNSPHRTVYTDGRELPKDPNPTWLGYSVGRWEGDTLVVATTGYNDRTFLDDFAGHRHTEALRVTERIRRRDLGHMDIEVTFEDPKAYAKPVKIAVVATLQPDTDLIEYVCNENERSRPHLVGTADDDRKSQVSVPAAVLARYAGRYRFPPLDPGDKPFDVTIAPKDGVLSVEIERGPTLTAIPTSQTKFLAQGESRGAKIINGYEMLLAQAEESWRIWNSDT